MTDVDGTCVVIPAYNEGAVLFEVVRAVRTTCDHVVVVDDGSADETAREALRAGAVVLRHLFNRGQGAALQTGIDYALQQGAEVIVTFDADGQHRVSDITRMVEALAAAGADVALGSRFLGARSNVPARRLVLLSIARRFMRLMSGVALTDAHNGLRALTADAAARIRLSIDGMAHASELVDEIRRHRLKFVEVPVVIEYSDYSIRKGQSGFAAFRIAFDYLFKRLFR